MRAVIWAGYGWEVDEVFEVRGGVEEPVENKILRGKIKENNDCDHKNDYPNQVFDHNHNYGHYQHCGTGVIVI